MTNCFNLQSGIADWIKRVKETLLEFVVTKMTTYFHVFQSVRLQNSLITITLEPVRTFPPISCSICTSIRHHLCIISVLLCTICVIRLVTFRLNLKPGKPLLKCFYHVLYHQNKQRSTCSRVELQNFENKETSKTKQKTKQRNNVVKEGEK